MLVAASIITFIIHPWTKDINKTVDFVDANLKEAKYSSGLLLVSDQELTSISKLQQYKVSQELQSKLRTLTPPNNLKRAILITILLIIIGGLGYKTDLFKGFSSSHLNLSEENKIGFVPIDSVSKNTTIIPELIRQKVTVSHPEYARVKKAITENPNVKTLVNSTISWQLLFNAEVSKVVIELNGKTYSIP